MSTRRVTITVDSDVLFRGHNSARDNGFASFSEWATAALAEKIEQEDGVAALAAALADFEAECGAISSDEIAEQRRVDAEAAVVVRGGHIVQDGRTSAMAAKRHR